MQLTQAVDLITDLLENTVVNTEKNFAQVRISAVVALANGLYGPEHPITQKLLRQQVEAEKQAKLRQEEAQGWDDWRDSLVVRTTQKGKNEVLFEVGHNDDIDLDVHTRHCCKIHGCKYGEDEVCTVQTTAHRGMTGNCQTCYDMDFESRFGG